MLKPITLTCHTEGCPNEGIPMPGVYDDDPEAGELRGHCGGCSQDITDITYGAGS